MHAYTPLARTGPKESSVPIGGSKNPNPLKRTNSQQLEAVKQEAAENSYDFYMFHLKTQKQPSQPKAKRVAKPKLLPPIDSRSSGAHSEASA